MRTSYRASRFTWINRRREMRKLGAFHGADYMRNALNVEPEQHDVAVIDDVVPAFLAHFSGFFSRAFTA